MEFKQWLFEYEADIDYDAKNPYANLLPVRRTVVHDIAADLRDDFGKVFSKRMGSGMPQGGNGYYNTNKDPVAMFNDNQYIYVTVEEPIEEIDEDQTKGDLARYMRIAYNKVKANHEIIKKLTAARVNFKREEYSKNAKTIVFKKNGKDYARFTFRFRANETPGSGYNYDNQFNVNNLTNYNKGN